MRLVNKLMCPIAAALLGVGCGSDKTENPPPTLPGETTFEIADTPVNVAAQGGEASVSYTLNNPKDGVSVLTQTEADWITDFDTSVAGTISFKVAENTYATERRAEVSVAYSDLKDNFTVVQEAVVNADAAFKITIEKQEDRGVVFSVTPKDKEMTYYVGGIPVAQLNSLPDDLTFVNEFVIPQLQKAAQTLNIPIEELMSSQLLKGDQTGQQIIGLNAETEYYVFCIGMTDKLEITSEFVKAAFKTGPLSAYDAELTVEVDGTKASVLVIPANEEIGWYPTVFHDHGHSNEAMIAEAQSGIEGAVMMNAIWGYSREATVAGLTQYGSKPLSYELPENADYTVAVFGLDALGYITTNPAIAEFTTGAAQMSNNVITVDYTNITGRKAEFIVRTTEPTDSYVFFPYSYTEAWKKLSDEEVIKAVLKLEESKLNSYTRRGDVSSYEDALRQKNEYVIYAFGYSAGSVTTKLFKSTFTTTEATQNDHKFEYEYGPYYNGDEAAEKYPTSLAGAVGKVVIPAKYKLTLPEGVFKYGVWHALYQGDLTDLEKFPDEDVYQALRNGGGNPWMSETVIYITNYDQISTFCGFAESKDGNFGAIYRQLVGPLTREGCSPIEGLVIPDATSANRPFHAPKFWSDYETEPVAQGPVTQIENTTSVAMPQAAPAPEQFKPLRVIKSDKSDKIEIISRYMER